jgi:hypothetical protein
MHLGKQGGELRKLKEPTSDKVGRRGSCVGTEPRGPLAFILPHSELRSTKGSRKNHTRSRWHSEDTGCGHTHSAGSCTANHRT